nr:MAG TPA: hypothetical protein [Caudoviricetes sp.]
MRTKSGQSADTFALNPWYYGRVINYHRCS